jgi:hypothetical protein
MEGEVRPMAHRRLSGDEIQRRGKQLYEQKIRQKVETEENIGKIVSIDVESGDYEVDGDLLQSAKRLLERRPDGALWSERIGYDVVYEMGGSSITLLNG